MPRTKNIKLKPLKKEHFKKLSHQRFHYILFNTGKTALNRYIHVLRIRSHCSRIVHFMDNNIIVETYFLFIHLYLLNEIKTPVMKRNRFCLVRA